MAIIEHKLSTMVRENFAFTSSQMATNPLKLSTMVGENFEFTSFGWLKSMHKKNEGFHDFS